MCWLAGVSVITLVLMVAFGGVRASRTLHSVLLRHVLRLPMTFFDATPMGRIVNRFSKDTAMADSVITFQAIQWLQVSSSYSRCSTRVSFTRSSVSQFTRCSYYLSLLLPIKQEHLFNNFTNDTRANSFSTFSNSKA